MTDALIRVAAELVETAHQGADWREPLGSLSRVFGGNNATLTLMFGDLKPVTRNIASHVSQEDQAAYAVRQMEDPRIRIGIQRVLSAGGKNVTRDEDVPDALNYVHTDIYREILRPNDVHRSLGAADFRNPIARVVLVVNRGRRSPAFSPHDVRLMTMLASFLPTISRLVVQHEERSLSQASDVAIVEDRRGVRFIAPAAVHWLRRGRPLYVEQNTLRHRTPTHDVRLRRLVADAIDGHRPRGLYCSVDSGVLIPLDTSHESSIRSFRFSSPAGEVEHRAEIRILSLEEPALIRLDWKLTPAETALVEALVAGSTVSSYASALGRSVHTVRNQLKSVFGKTGCRSQRELVLQWLSASAWPQSPGD